MEVLRHKFKNEEGEEIYYRGSSTETDRIREFLEAQSLSVLENYVNFNKWIGYYSEKLIHNGVSGRVGADVGTRYNGKNPFFYKLWQANRDTILNVHFEI